MVSWNCNGALRKKISVVDSLNAEIVIVQECEDPSQSTRAYREWSGDFLWCGQNKNKGIGIFPKKGNVVRKLDWSGAFSITGLSSESRSITWTTEELELFLPFRVNDTYTVLACWTKGSDIQAFGYMGQFWKYLQIHKNQLCVDDTIIAGDFNSNSRWDKPDRWWSHTDTVNELSKLGIYSLYHEQEGERQGFETSPTFFLQRNPAKPYHIDFVFLSKNLMHDSHLMIGGREKWLAVSDHLPLLCTLSR